MKLPKLFKREPPAPTIIEHVYDMIPPFDWENATTASATVYLGKLTRVQLLEIHDREIIPDPFWDEYYEALDKHELWPTDKDQRDALDKLYWNTDSMYKHYSQAQKQIDGIQKKVDNIMKVLERFDVTLSAKDAVDLAKS